MMSSDTETDLPTIIRQADNARERLIFAVGPAGSGKTAWLRAIAASHSLAYISLGTTFARRLAELSTLQRPLAIARTIESILPADRTGVCLDNTDLLFLPELQCDPMRLVAQLSQHRLIIAAFCGTFENGRFTRAYPDHPEYVSFPLSGFTVASFASGQPTFIQT